jgi:4-diphosphocytidyl-2-C-methyl-D-erythritol kinase
MIIKAYPKINIGLDILRRREDGYHDIDTLMVPFSGVHDTLEVERNNTGGCNLKIDGLEINCSADRNLVMKVWFLMHERYNIGGVNMRLEKRIPFGAGLGGGSADAVAAIKGIADVYDLHITDEEMVELAAKIGSDVPFFVYSKPMFCRGRGELLSPADVNLDGLWCVVSKPKFGISTPEAYAGVTPHIPTTPLEERLRLPRTEWQEAIVNDFEASLFGRYTALPNIKFEMKKRGAIYSSLSGSGSAMYGLFESEPNYEPIFLGEEIFVCRL